MDKERSKSEELAVYWAQHQPAIAGYISTLVSNFQDADDLLQSVAVVTVEKFDTYDSDKSFVAWAIGIARNLVLKYYADQKKTRAIMDPQTIEAISDVYSKEFKSIIQQNDMMKHALDHCVQQLKGKWRKMLEMYYLRELSPARISQRLGMTPNNVFVSLHRVRMTLRECVKNQLSRDYA